MKKTKLISEVKTCFDVHNFAFITDSKFNLNFILNPLLYETQLVYIQLVFSPNQFYKNN